MRAINRVRREHAAEEQHFGDQEGPHAEHRAVELLRRRRKVVPQVGDGSKRRRALS